MENNITVNFKCTKELRLKLKKVAYKSLMNSSAMIRSLIEREYKKSIEK